MSRFGARVDEAGAMRHMPNMTPEELAARVPRLYHVTAPGAQHGIRRHGLLSAKAALGLFEVAPAEARALISRRRPTGQTITHPRHGRIVLNDNIPLSETALRACLDDGLSPADWLRMLNARVFFWPSEAGVARLLAARTNRVRAREVLVFDTLSLARAHGPHLCLSPINSGSTIRKPARRGLTTFTPLDAMPYRDWQALRGRRDTIREITIDHAVPDAADHIIEVRHHGPE